MKRVWRKDNKEGVSPVIATILMVAITVVLAAVLYVMVSDFMDDGDGAPLAGSLTLDGNSVPNDGNATLRLTISKPSHPAISNMETKLFDPNNDQVTDAVLIWKHIASDVDDDYFTSGDKLQISNWPTDLSGYRVVVTVDGNPGTIEYAFD